MITRIESKSIIGEPRKYLVGHNVLSSQTGAELKNMDVTNVLKHKEELPIINTLSILATVAAQKQFEEKGTQENGETIKLDVDMTTALPASNLDSESEKEFKEKFDAHLHEVKV